MEAVGAVATIIGLVQVGLSLAKALNTYVGTVSDYNDDISKVANDIYATFRHLNDLEHILKQNEKTEVLTEDALVNAQKCISEASTIVLKLKELLVKGSGKNNATDLVESNQIDISKFRKGFWYVYKSEFELRRTELSQMKADISLIYLTYLALAAGTKTERVQAQEEMALIYNRKIALVRDVKKAREKRDRDLQGHSRNPEVESDMSDDSDREVGSALWQPDEGAIVYDNIEALQLEFSHWLEQKKEKEAAQVAERQQIKDGAIDEYQKATREKEQKAAAQTKQFSEVLLKHGVPPQRVHRMVKDMFPDSPLEAGVGDDEVTINDGTLGLNINVIPGKGRDETDQELLHDPSQPGGMARLKAYYVQATRMTDLRVSYTAIELAVSGNDLRSKFKSMHANKGSSFSNPRVEAVGDVPEHYLLWIGNELTRLEEAMGEKWLLLNAEVVRSKLERRRSRFWRKKPVSPDDLGIHVIFRRAPLPERYTNAGGPEVEEYAEVTPKTLDATEAAVETRSKLNAEAAEKRDGAGDSMYAPLHARYVGRPSTRKTPGGGEYTAYVQTEYPIREVSKHYHAPPRSRARFTDAAITMAEPLQVRGARTKYDRTDHRSRSRTRSWDEGADLWRYRNDRSRSSSPEQRDRYLINETRQRSRRPAFLNDAYQRADFGESEIIRIQVPRKRRVSRRNETDPKSRQERTDSPTKQEPAYTTKFSRQYDPATSEPEATTDARVSSPEPLTIRYPEYMQSRSARGPRNRRLSSGFVPRRSLSWENTADVSIPVPSGLGSEAAVQVLLNQWGSNTQPVVLSDDENEDEDVVVGPLSRRSTIGIRDSADAAADARQPTITSVESDGEDFDMKVSGKLGTTSDLS